MNYTIKNNTNKDMSTLHDMVNAYFPYAQENMGFDLPVTVILESDLENAENPLGKTAYYDPTNYTVVLYTDGRHPKDIMRSLSHELVHHKQNCNGELGGIAGEQGYAQTENGHRIEEEAYSLGNTCFRNWEDGVKKRTNETTYSKRRILNMNEEILRNAIRKVIEESPTFKKHFKTKETALESTESISEGEGEGELKERAPDWFESPDLGSVGQEGEESEPCPEGQERGDDGECKEKEKVVTEAGGGCEEQQLAFDEATQEFENDPASRDPNDQMFWSMKAYVEKTAKALEACTGVNPYAKKEPQVSMQSKFSGLDEDKEEEVPLKEWYDNSLYGKLLKEYTGGKK